MHNSKNVTVLVFLQYHLLPGMKFLITWAPYTPTSCSDRPPRLVKKKNSKSRFWKYFAFEADDQGLVIDSQKTICKRCQTAFQTKGGNTSNLAKHLKDRLIHRIQGEWVSSHVNVHFAGKSTPIVLRWTNSPSHRYETHITRNRALHRVSAHTEIITLWRQQTEQRCLCKVRLNKLCHYTMHRILK